jgi:hypothetical protein
MEKWRGTTLSILKFEISINVVKILIPNHTAIQKVVEVSLDGYLQLSLDLPGLRHLFMNAAIGATM